MTKPLNNISLSMLDLVAVREGRSVADALAVALRTAQHAEVLGFKRYWLAEHHNMSGIASSATAVLVGHIAGGTQRMRVGSGGVMLPNHAPLVVAEAFGTLAELYPGRIDLGLGRAPGTDPLTMRALRRDRAETESDFPRDVAELQHLLGPAQPGQRLVAMPGAGTNVPIWLLGSSRWTNPAWWWAFRSLPRPPTTKPTTWPAAPTSACWASSPGGAVNCRHRYTASCNSCTPRNAPALPTFWQPPSLAGLTRCARASIRWLRPPRPTSSCW